MALSVSNVSRSKLNHAASPVVSRFRRIRPVAARSPRSPLHLIARAELPGEIERCAGGSPGSPAGLARGGSHCGTCIAGSFARCARYVACRLLRCGGRGGCGLRRFAGDFARCVRCIACRLLRRGGRSGCGLRACWRLRSRARCIAAVCSQWWPRRLRSPPLCWQLRCCAAVACRLLAAVPRRPRSPHQLVELAEHFVHDGFHFSADDGQSEHRLGGFTEFRNQRTKGIADGFLKGLGKLGPLGVKSAELGGDVSQFRQSCCGAGLVLDGSDTVACVFDQAGGVTD